MPNSDPPENHPLAERFSRAEHLARELSEHLQQGFLPRLSDLRAASKIFDPESMSDHAMLEKINSVLASNRFAMDLMDRLFEYLESIQNDTREMLGA